MAKLVIFDANALLHRVFHALPAMTDRSGRPTNAIYGLSSMLLKALKDLKPDYICAAYDSPELTFRHKEFKQYKETRAKTPLELEEQLLRSEDIFKAFGIRIFKYPGYEADDIIGTLSHKFASKEVSVIIVTGDSDTFQLVNEFVSVMTMRKGMSDTVMYTPEKVLERYGFGPESLPDFKGLVGDSSDNIPGVKGVGEKTATELIRQCSNIEEIYSALNEGRLNPKSAKKLENTREQALFSRGLATIFTGLELGVSLNDMQFKDIDRFAVEKIFKDLDFTSLIDRLMSGVSSSVKEAPQVDLFSSNVKFKNKDLIFFETEKDKVFLYESGGKVYSVELSEIPKVLAETDLKAGMQVKELHKAYFARQENPTGSFFDMRVAGWLLRSDVTKPTPERLVKYFLGRGADSVAQRLMAYSELLSKQKELLKEHNLEPLFNDIEMPLLRVLAKMEFVGLRLNKDKIQDLKGVLNIQLSAQEKRIQEISGAKINIGSPQQLRELLFSKLSLKAAKMRKTKTGVISTSEAELLKMKDQHPIVEEILNWRAISKILTTYTDSLVSAIDPKTLRVHPIFEETGTATGRISSENPNMQNLPHEGEMSQYVLDAFEAEPGFTFVAFDYSQIELRIAAHLSRDENLKNIFIEGEDIHTYVAKSVFKDENSRRKAKVLNFGILYGMGPKSLSELTGFSSSQAKNYIAEYFSRFPGVLKYVEDTKNKAKALGYAETITGRKRFLPELSGWGYRETRAAEREAINFPIQGTGADILKKAMVDIDAKMDKYFPHSVRPVLTIHDELVFEIKEEIISEVADTIKYAMEHAYELDVPIKVSYKTGKTLATCKK